MHYSYLVVDILIGIILPVYALLTARSTMQMMMDTPGIKKQMYIQTSIFQLVSVVVIVVLIYFNGDTWSEIGLSFANEWLLIVLLFLIPTSLLCIFHLFNYPFFSMTFVRRQYGHVLFLLPATRQEYHFAIATSFVVGICEEIIYRGFLYWQALSIMPDIPAILVINIVFGISHAATKWKNAMGAFLMGVALSIVTILTGDLWVAMLLHILADLFAMIMSYRYHQLEGSIFEENEAPLSEN